MRRFLTVLGGLMLAVIVAVAVGFGVLFYKGSALDAEAKAYVDGAVPAIVAPWNQDALLERLTPQQRAAVRAEQLHGVAAAITGLGPFVAYEGAKGGANITIATGPKGSMTTAGYVATVKFADGVATIRLLLVKQDGHWMIGGFHLDTPRTGVPGAGSGLTI